MAGTKESAQKAKLTNLLKYGPDWYRTIGAKGGRNGRGHSFGHGKVDPSVVGRIGGSISRRTKPTV